MKPPHEIGVLHQAAFPTRSLQVADSIPTCHPLDTRPEITRDRVLNLLHEADLALEGLQGHNLLLDGW